MGIWIVVILIIAVVFMLFQAEMTYIRADRKKSKEQKGDNA